MRVVYVKEEFEEREAGEGRDTATGSGALSGGGIARALHRRLMTWLSIGRNEACRRIWTEWAVEARGTRFRHTEKSGTEEHGERTGSTGRCSAAH